MLLIDLQNDYCHPDGVFARKAQFNVDSIPAIYPNLQKAIRACRERNIPVIWVAMVWDSDEEVGILAERSLFLQKEGLRRGTWGAEVVSELEKLPHDPVVEKKRFSSFFDTTLSDVLDRHGVRKLIVGGVRTDFCVESTVRDAFFRDYDVVVLSDGVAGYFPLLHEGSLRVMGTVFAKVMTVDETIGQL